MFIQRPHTSSLAEGARQIAQAYRCTSFCFCRGSLSKPATPILQEVYDALVHFLESVSHHEMYILESAAGLAKTVFKSVCVLLSHPQQRAPQEELGEYPRWAVAATNVFKARTIVLSFILLYRSL